MRILFISAILLLSSCSPEKAPEIPLRALTPKRPLSWKAKGRVTLRGKVKGRVLGKLRVMIEDYFVDLSMTDIDINDIVGCEVEVSGHMIEKDKQQIIFADTIRIISDSRD